MLSEAEIVKYRGELVSVIESCERGAMEARLKLFAIDVVLRGDW